MAQTVHASGSPEPAAGSILQVNGRNGLLYEHMAGQNMWDVFEKQPWRLFSMARLAARLHVEMHANMIQADLPPQRQRLENKLRGAYPLPDSIRQAFLEK